MAAAKGVAPNEIIVCVLDRPRHAELIAELRALGCGIQLIPDGDVAGVIAVTDPETTVDLYLAKGDCIFAATGVTDGSLLRGVKRRKGGKMTTESVVMRASSGTVRWVRGEHCAS